MFSSIKCAIRLDEEFLIESDFNWQPEERKEMYYPGCSEDVTSIFNIKCVSKDQDKVSRFNALLLKKDVYWKICELIEDEIWTQKENRHEDY